MRVLMTWEMGGGWGHIARCCPVARGLLERGHEVVLAVREPERTIPHAPGATVMPLPAVCEAPLTPVSPPCSFPDMLYDLGWHSDTELQRLTTAWLGCIDRVAPDVLVMDYSPTALLASQARILPRILLSTGFTSPPDVAPLPNLRPGVDRAPTEEQCARETAILERMNRFLEANGADPLQRLAQLFSRVALDVLATWPELDHYGARPGEHYSGVWSDALGEPPDWPPGKGPRVFAYLKNFPALAALLQMLQRSRLPVLVYLSGVEPELRQRAASASLRIVGSPVDLASVARDSDLAVLNAGHGATAAMLLAGTPILEIPLVLEQFLVAKRVLELGAGQVASQDSPEQIARGLQRLLTDMHFTRRAQAFWKRYRGFDAERQIDSVVDSIVSLA